MAASPTLPRSRESHKFGKTGVLTISGYGLKVLVRSGHLHIEDGTGSERRVIRLPRVGHGLKRLVCISDDGFITLSALEWLSDVGAAFVMLNRLGKVQFVTGPTSPSDARLRRSQAVALTNGVGLEISRTLIHAKLEGQERLVRTTLGDSASADLIARLRGKLEAADRAEEIRVLEAHAAIAYFGAWRDVPVLWPKADLRKIPERWRFVGARQSPLSGGPRLAVTPFHAMLNYLASVLASECRLLLTFQGLDPGLGMGLHTDTRNRDSLALDVLEPVRPQLEGWLFQWVTQEPLHRSDFFETANGCVRLMSSFAAHLSSTALTWRKLLAPWVEYVARTLWESSLKPIRSIPTRLTQQNRRESKGQPSFPIVEVRRPEHLCSDCGVKIPSDNKLCSNCAKPARRKNFNVGRKSAQQPESLAKRSATQRKHKEAIRNWRPSDLPVWLTRDVYLKQVQPALATVAKSRIGSTLGVSEPYSSDIWRGKVPHPRHWRALAQLVGVSSDA
jgi:CRISPR-associated endonuclease Cas1